MKRLFIITLWIALCSATSAFSKYIAVLETISHNDAEVSTNEKLFITDELRAEAVTALSRYDFTIMTRENINVMLPPGKNIEECEGSCLVETGRNISADYVVQGRIGKFGDELTLTVELYETVSGKLIGNITAKNEVVQGLLLELKGKSENLFKAIIPEEEAPTPTVTPVKIEEDATPTVSANVKNEDDHFFPRWVPWVSLGLGTIFWVMGYYANQDMIDCKASYDNMTDESSVGDFDDKWEDVENYRDNRNAWYAMGSALYGISILIFTFD